MRENESRYFIAIIPPPLVCTGIRRLQEEFAIRYKAKKALAIMPHLTLRPPFQVSIDEEKYFLDWFTQLQLNAKPFAIELDGFAAFHNARQPVIYLNVLQNSTLVDLHVQLDNSLAAAFPRLNAGKPIPTFTPHITIAYRDLKTELFELAWQDYQQKPYAAYFEVKQLHLMKHNGHEWTIIANSPF